MNCICGSSLATTPRTDCTVNSAITSNIMTLASKLYCKSNPYNLNLNNFTFYLNYQVLDIGLYGSSFFDM